MYPTIPQHELRCTLRSIRGLSFTLVSPHPPQSFSEKCRETRNSIAYIIRRVTDKLHEEVSIVLDSAALAASTAVDCKLWEVPVQVWSV